MAEAISNNDGKIGLPDFEIHNIAMALLPGMLEYMSTEKGRQEYEAWKKENNITDDEPDEEEQEKSER